MVVEAFVSEIRIAATVRSPSIDEQCKALGMDSSEPLAGVFGPVVVGVLFWLFFPPCETDRISGRGTNAVKHSQGVSGGILSVSGKPIAAVFRGRLRLAVARRVIQVFDQTTWFAAKCGNAYDLSARFPVQRSSVIALRMT